MRKYYQLVIKEIGVTYDDVTLAELHAQREGYTIAKVSRPLTYTTHVTTTTNPFTKEVETTEHKVYVDDITEEEIGDGVRVLRDLKFAETNFAVERHREELELGLPTSLTEAEYQAVLQYRQDLRDLPLQAGFPQTYTLPTNPLNNN